MMLKRSRTEIEGTCIHAEGSVDNDKVKVEGSLPIINDNTGRIRAHEFAVPDITKESCISWMFGVGPEELKALKGLKLEVIGDLIALEEKKFQDEIIAKIADKNDTTDLKSLYEIMEFRSRLEEAENDTKEGEKDSTELRLNYFLRMFCRFFKPKYSVDKGEIIKSYELRGYKTQDRARCAIEGSSYFRVSRLRQLIREANEVLQDTAGYYERYRTTLAKWKGLESTCKHLNGSEGDSSGIKKIKIKGSLVELDCLKMQVNPFCDKDPSYEDLFQLDILPFHWHSPLSFSRMSFCLKSQILFYDNLSSSSEKVLQLAVNKRGLSQLKKSIAFGNYQQEYWFPEEAFDTVHPSSTEHFNCIESYGKHSLFEKELSQKDTYSNVQYSVTFDSEFDAKNLFSRQVEAIQTLSKKYLERNLDSKEDCWVVLGNRVRISDKAFQKMNIDTKSESKLLRAECTTIADIAGEMISELYPYFPNELITILVQYLNGMLEEEDDARAGIVSVSQTSNFYQNEKVMQSFKEDSNVKWYRFLLNESQIWKMMQFKTHLNGSQLWMFNEPRDLKKSNSTDILFLSNIWYKSFQEKTIFDTKDIGHTVSKVEKILPDMNSWMEANYAANRLKRELFDYQKKQIYDMSNLEQHIVTSDKKCYSSPFSLSVFEYHRNGIFLVPSGNELKSEESFVEKKSSILFDRMTRTFFPRLPDEDLNEIRSKFPRLSLRGGILADEVGLGKTFTILGLCALNRRNMKTFFHEGLIFNRMQKVNGRYITGATLIACPNTLIKQICSEIERSLALPDSKVLQICTKTQHDKINAFDIMQAEIVLVSYSFLGGPYYNAKFTTNVFAEYSENCAQDPYAYAPSLDNFQWHRVVVDESHELFGMKAPNKRYLDIACQRLIHYSASTKWAISATPFSQLDPQFKNYCDFLDIRLENIPLHDVAVSWMRCANLIHNEYDITSDGYRVAWKELIASAFEDFVIFRNTKVSVSSENSIPEYENFIVPVKLSEHERLLYDGVPCFADKLAICSCPLLLTEIDRENGEPLDDIYTRVLNKLTEEVVRFDGAIEREEAYIDRIRRRVESQRSLSITVRRAQAHYAFNSDDEIDLINHLAAQDRHNFEQDERILKNLELELRRMKATRILYARSVHLLTSRRPESREYSPISYTISSDYSEEEFWSNFISYWGSKLAAVCKFVVDTLQDIESRIIIFSAHDSMLSCIQRLLLKLSVKVAVCRGNVFVRGNILEAFRNKHVDRSAARVLAMSLSNSASGADLLSCTHIILLDTLLGSKQYAQATEMQAIGRACRQGQDHSAKIVRFLCEETEEVRLYWQRSDASDSF